jgi:hypothetical protein
MTAITTLTEMETAILEVVRRTRGALFTDLEKEVDGFAGEDCSWCLEGFGTAYMWPSLSHAGARSLSALRRAGLIHLKPVTPFLYLHDGFCSKHPTATVAGLKRGYKTPHWIPVSIRPAAGRRPRGGGGFR